MRVGIFGYAGVGKSTIFRALSGGDAGQAGSGRPGALCTIKVPDERVDRLAAMFRPKKVVHVSITFQDIDPGGTELLPAETLAMIREGDVLSVVLRGFSTVFHPAPAEGLDPVKEFRAIQSGLIVADYLVAQKRIERMTKEARRDAEWNVLHKAVAALEQETPLRGVPFTVEETRILAGFRFASQIPLVAVLNVEEEALAHEPFPEFGRAASSSSVPLIRLSAKIEEEIALLSPEEQSVFLTEMGIGRPARDLLVRGSFDAMDQICFMTVVEEEVRAWNVPRGTTAIQAAGKIHSDMERGFIRAEAIQCGDLFRCGSMTKAKSEGQVRLEGKDYVVQDGDVLYIRFHV